jgi:hypothetical protein
MSTPLRACLYHFLSGQAVLQIFTLCCDERLSEYEARNFEENADQY